MFLFSKLIKTTKKLIRLSSRREIANKQYFDSLSSEEKALMIDALYTSPHVMVIGIVAIVFATLFCFAQSADTGYLYLAVAFFISGLSRIIQMHQYQNSLASRTFTEWKSSVIRSGVVFCFLLGSFCAYAIFSHNHFNELIAFCMMFGALMTIPNRSYGSRRLVNYQVAAISAPVLLALVAQHDLKYLALACLSFPMLFSIVQLSNKSRETLLKVIQSGAEFKKLLVQFDTATSFMQHGFIIIDKEQSVVIANSRALQLLGVEESENWVGQKYDDMLSFALKNNRLTAHSKEQLSYSSLNTNVIIGTDKAIAKTSDGEYIESSASFRDGQLVLLLEDVTERIRTADRITYMATHDSLTGLCNREHFHDLFNQHLSQRSDGRCMLVVVDLDEFKRINDTYGHTAGDELLCSAASTIEAICGDYAIACRFGGDEFVIFAPHITDESEIQRFPERLLSALSNKVQLSHGSVQPKASAGIVVEDHSKATSDGMFAKADLALYESKAKSRGGWTLYNASLDANYHERQMLKDDLSVALERDDLAVMFQPIVNLASKRVSTFEALSRWQHPTRGNISPAIFIPLAEEMGIVGSITLVVLRKSIEECCKWPSDIGVSVNLSAIDFDNPNLVSLIDNLLSTANLRPDRLEVEITEGTFIENKKLVADAVSKLRKLGVRIALDDFGTGYSNFSYLQEVNLDKLKIDRCFVKDILENHRSALLLSGISDIAKRLDIAVTVEGIETEEQLIAVKKIAKVDNIQGWVFSKAVNSDEALNLTSHLFNISDTEEYAFDHAPLGIQKSA